MYSEFNLFKQLYFYKIFAIKIDATHVSYQKILISDEQETTFSINKQ